MSAATTTILVLGAATYVLKATGPLLLGGGRSLPGWLERTSTALPAALLAALVVTSTFTAGTAWTVDARAVGLLAAALALWRRLPFVVVVLIAAGTTAGWRALVA